MDRIDLIEFLALALLINAAAILLVLRARWRPRSANDHPGSTDASPGPGPATVAPDTVAGPTDPPGAVTGPINASPGVPPLVGVMEPASDDHAQWPAPAQLEWSDRIRIETARCQRYSRSAAIVAMRLDGIDAVAADAGPAVGAWLCTISTRTLHELARDSDLVQSDGHGRFRALLVETDEAGARSYVERVSRLLVPWPDDPRPPVRLVAGWAGSWLHADLETADRLAQARMLGSSGGWIRSVSTWPM